LDHDARAGVGWLKVVQGGHLVEDGRVVSVGLPGETVKVIPVRGDSGALRVSQCADVMCAGDPLVHQLQDVRVEVLDTRLDVDGSGVTQRLEVVSPDVRLDLEDHAQVIAGLGDAGQHRVEVAHVDDVVDDGEVQDLVLAGQAENL